MKSYIKLLVIVLCVLPSKALAGDFTCNIQGDIVSSHVWRGMYQAGFSMQPSVKLAYKGLSLSEWGNAELTKDGQREVDWYLDYNITDNLCIEISDNWSIVGKSKGYFYYRKDTEHSWEGRVTYTLPIKKFPLTLSWGTMFAGNDFNDNGKRAFSSYFILTYPFKIKMIDMTIDVGMSPYKSQGMYGCDGFSLNQIAAKASYTVNPCKHLSIPIYTQLVANPATNNLYFVLGVAIATDF